MWIVGLTGAIGSGKSTLAQYIEGEGIPVHCADEVVHRLLQTNPTIQKKIKEQWPDVFRGGQIDRNLLGNTVLVSLSELILLENILYPEVARQQKEFLQTHQKNHLPIVVLDVPLLFEVGLDHYCHYVILTSAPFSVRKRRVLTRAGMTPQKFNQFEAYQMKESERRKRADFIVPTGQTEEKILKKVHEIFAFLRQKQPITWQGKWPSHLKRESSYGT